MKLLRLNNYQEIVGVLENIEKESFELRLKIDRYELVLPRDGLFIPIELLGKEIGILRLEDRYYLRQIKTRKKAKITRI